MPDSDRLSPAEERILEVREHFLAALLDFDAAQRRRLVEFLLEHCAVVLVATMGIDRAHRMFMVLNETGKPLARNDILKAELLGSIPGGVAGSACATWDAVETRLGAEFESLFSHVRTMYGRASSQVIAGVRAVTAECGGAEAFIGNVLAPSATILDDLRHARHAGSVHSADIARTLTYLSWLPASDWIPPAMLWWLAKGKDPAELAWFLQRLDRLAYGMRILGLGASRRAKRFGDHHRRHPQRQRSESHRQPAQPAARGDPQHRAQPARICTPAARRSASWCCCASTTRWPAGRRSCRSAS